MGTSFFIDLSSSFYEVGVTHVPGAAIYYISNIYRLFNPPDKMRGNY